MDIRATTTHLVPRRMRGIFYGWWLVPVAGVIHTLTSVPLFHAMGLWFVALESTFGWNRTQLSLAFSLTRIEGGLLGPVEGYLADRLGSRRTIFIGLIILGIGFLFLWQVRSLWMFYVAFLLMALGQGLGGWLPLNTMLNNWFIRNRATAMGWSSSLSRLGALLFIPAMAWAVDPEQDNLGWQSTALILGLFTLLMVIPVTKLVRNRPEEYGLLPDGDPPQAQPTSLSANAYRVPVTSPSDGDFTVPQALRTPAFWLIAFGHGFTSMVIIAIMAHLAPLLTDEGFSVPLAGLVVTAYTATSMVFQVIGGYIGDRIPKRVALFIFASIQAGSILIITFSPTITMAFVFALLFGIGFGGRNPLTTSIRGDYFGRKAFGSIMGISQLPMNILLLIAPIFAGYLRDTQGDYTIAFLTLAALNMVGATLLLLAKKPRLPQSIS